MMQQWGAFQKLFDTGEFDAKSMSKLTEESKKYQDIGIQIAMDQKGILELLLDVVKGGLSTIVAYIAKGSGDTEYQIFQKQNELNQHGNANTSAAMIAAKYGISDPRLKGRL